MKTFSVIVLLAFIFGALIATTSQAHDKGKQESHATSAVKVGSTKDVAVINPGEFQWKKMDALPLRPEPGAFGVTVLGDPNKNGDYAKFVRWPAKFTVPSHWHTNDVYVVMIKGSMVIKRQGKADVAINEGGFFYLPAKLKYVATCDNECSFLVWGSKAFDIFYANPSDDPRKQAKK